MRKMRKMRKKMDGDLANYPRRSSRKVSHVCSFIHKQLTASVVYSDVKFFHRQFLHTILSKSFLIASFQPIDDVSGLTPN